MKELVFLKGKEPVTTSLAVAEGTNNQHESIIRLIQKHQERFERWGKVYFTDLPAKNQKGNVGRPQKVAFLNEQQTIFLLLILKNSASTMEFKANLIDDFYKLCVTSMALRNWLEVRENNHQQRKCVYILSTSNNLIKIGVTSNFNRRINAIMTSSCTNIIKWCHTDDLPNRKAYEIESACHKTFRDKRIKGEFFKISFDDAVAELQKHAEIAESSE